MAHATGSASGAGRPRKAVWGALRGNPAGMPAVTETAGGCLVRPFLQIRRADTAGACDELGLQPWHDPMNDDTAYRRVAVRKSIIPALSDLIGGDAAAPLAKTAERIAADNALIDEVENIKSARVRVLLRMRVLSLQLL